MFGINSSRMLLIGCRLSKMNICPRFLSTSNIKTDIMPDVSLPLLTGYLRKPSMMGSRVCRYMRKGILISK